MALEDKILTVYCPGTMLRDYNYVDDVAEALILSSQCNKTVGETLFLGGEKVISLMDLANLIVKIAGKGKVKVIPSPREWASIEIGDFYVDYGKIRRMIGWYPKTDIETGLRKSIDFYKERMYEYV